VGLFLARVWLPLLGFGFVGVLFWGGLFRVSGGFRGFVGLGRFGAGLRACLGV
jgi:hypothetical protein